LRWGALVLGLGGGGCRAPDAAMPSALVRAAGHRGGGAGGGLRSGQDAEVHQGDGAAGQHAQRVVERASGDKLVERLVVLASGDVSGGQGGAGGAGGALGVRHREQYVLAGGHGQGWRAGGRAIVRQVFSGGGAGGGGWDGVERRVERKWRLGLTVSVGAVIVVGMKFNKGDVVCVGHNVRVEWPDHPTHGKIGTVLTRSLSSALWLVSLHDEGDAVRSYRTEHLVRVVPVTTWVDA
jgi:hypothetical protein